MTKKTVSVIIPCFNGERYLAEAIESVLNQSYPVSEILVVDNASTDGSKAIIDRYAQQYAQVKCLSLSPQRGEVETRNQGIAKSSGTYLVILDCGDRLLPQAIEAGVNALNAHPDWMFAFGPCRRICENGQSALPGRKVLEQPVVGSVYRTLLRGNCLNPFGRHIFRRILFDLIGDFDQSFPMANDYDFYLRATARFCSGSHGQMVVEYRQQSTLSQQSENAKYLQEILAIYAKQQPFAQRKPEDAAAHQEGLQHWRRLYRSSLASNMARSVKQGQLPEAGTAAYFLLHDCSQGMFTHARKQVSQLVKPLQPLAEPILKL